MNNISLIELQKAYIRGKEILEIVSNADYKDMQAVILKKTWNLEAIKHLRELVEMWEDEGIQKTIRRVD